MKRVLWLAAFAACGGGTGDDFPVQPGGPSGPNTPLDAALIDAPSPDGGALLTGRVCVADDLRRPTESCATTGAGGITVTLGTKTATTMADGSFTIAEPGASNPVWRAEGQGFVSSVMPFGASKIIPITSEQDYSDLQNANSVLVVSGSIVVRVVKNGALQQGVDVTVAPLADDPARYANNGELAWPELASGTTEHGIAWIPNAQLGANTVTGTPDLGMPDQAIGLVEAQSITYLTIELP